MINLKNLKYPLVNKSNIEFNNIHTYVYEFNIEWNNRGKLLPLLNGAPPAARHAQILPMNQHACWPITIGMKYSTVREISEPVDGNTTICKVHFT
jgi:hypothetical protein